MSLSIFYRAPEKDQGPKIKDWSSGVNALSRQIHVKNITNDATDIFLIILFLNAPISS
jgi:hypothetical protein